VEERKSWLPAGLEGSGWEPDDRSSQRSNAGSKRSGTGADASGPWQPNTEKSPDSGPNASSGNWQPYDPNRPESKRSRKDAEPDEADSRQAAAPKSEGEEARNEDRDRKDTDDGKENDGEKDEPKSERDGDSEQGTRSDVDAMGQDKHRQVIGQRVGASRTKQLAYYGAFVAFVIVAYLGLKVAVSHFDKAPAHDKAQAPWSQKNAPDEPLGGFTPKTKGEKGPTRFQ
jgi:hypothetical protein